MTVPGRIWRCLLTLATAAAVLVIPDAGVSAQGTDHDYWQPSNLPQIGLATYYAPGLMDYVHDYRVQRGQLPDCPDCVGSVALLRAGDIGRKIWLQPPGGELAGPFLVVDCARTEDVEPLLDRNWVVDVSYELGQTWGLNGPLDGVIVWADPSEGNAPRPAAQPTLFYIDPRDVIISLPTPTPAAVQVGALPTRIPVPRGGVQISTAAPKKLAEAPVTKGPPPLTPIITTPTPAGWAPSAATPAPGSHSPSTLVPEARSVQGGQQAGGTENAGGALNVSFGRPGAGLLASSRPAAPPRVLAVPVATPGRMRPSLFPTPRPAPTSDAPSGIVVPAAQDGAGQRNLFQRIWDALRDLVAPGSSGDR